MRNGVFSLIVLFAFSCNSGGVRDEEKEGSLFSYVEEKETLNQQGDSVALATQWLVKTIEDFFANFSESGGDYSGFCTDQYIEFKKDATHVNIEGYLTEEEFIQKWRHRQIEFAGIGDGFLISGQDFGTIKVTTCTYKKPTESGGWLFKIVLEDIEFGTIFLREITVIPAGDSFIIDDVAEIENIYPE